MRFLYILTLIVIFWGCSSNKLPLKNLQNIEDNFEVVDGIAIPFLSADKKEFKNYKRFETKKNHGNSYINIDSVYHDQNKNIVSNEFDFKSGTISTIKEIYVIESSITNNYFGPTKFTYEVYLSYHLNGKIKSYRVFLNYAGIKDLKVGTWYNFDQNGYILKQYEHEKQYQTSLADVIKIRDNFLREKVLIEHQIYSFENIIRFTDLVGKRWWLIFYYDSITHEKMTITIEDDLKKITINKELYSDAKFINEQTEKLYKDFSAN